MKSIENINKFLSYLFFLIPISLVSGPFIPDLIVSIIGFSYFFILFKKGELNTLINKGNLIFIFFCIYITLRALFSIDVPSSILPSIFYFRFGLFLLATVYLIKVFPNFQNQFTKILLLTILFVSIDAYIQIIFGYNLFGMKNEVSDRVSGLFGDEYVLGSYLVRLFPLLIALMIDKITSSLKYKILFLLGAVFFNILIFLIAERTAFALNILFFIIFTLIIKKTRVLMIITFVISFFGLFVAGNLNKSTHERMVSQTINEVFKGGQINVFTEGHQNHLEAAIKMFEDNILFGHGLKTFRILCKDPKYYETVTSCSTHPHNTYAQLLSETGLIGFIIILGLFLIMCKNLILYFFRSFHKVNDKVSDKVKILTILIFVNLFPLVPTGSFFNNWISIIYFLPLGIYLSSKKIN